MTKDEALKLALEALMRSRPSVDYCKTLESCAYGRNYSEHKLADKKKALTMLDEAITAIREALAEQPAQQQEKTMPITDDHGKAIQPQYRVIEQCGNWFLLYDQHQIGNTVTHEFRIQKLKHDILLYRGITLEEAKKRFLEKVEADNE